MHTCELCCGEFHSYAATLLTGPACPASSINSIAESRAYTRTSESAQCIKNMQNDRGRDELRRNLRYMRSTNLLPHLRRRRIKVRHVQHEGLCSQRCIQKVCWKGPTELSGATCLRVHLPWNSAEYSELKIQTSWHSDLLNPTAEPRLDSEY